MKTNTGAIIFLFVFFAVFFFPAIQSALAALLCLIRGENPVAAASLRNTVATDSDESDDDLERVLFEHEIRQPPDSTAASGKNEVWGGVTDILNHWDTPPANRFD